MLERQLCSQPSAKYKTVFHIVRNVEYVGGAEQFILRALPRLNSSSRRMVLCCLEGVGARARSLEPLGVEVVDLPSQQHLSLQTLRRLAQVIKDYRADLVHTHLFEVDVPGIIVSRLTGKPCVSTKYALFSRPVISRSAWESYVVKPLCDRVVELLIDLMCTRIVAVSEAVKCHLIRIGVPANKVIVIPSSIFDPASWSLPCRSRKLSGSRKFKVVTTSRLVPQKDIETLLQAAVKVVAHYPWVTFHVYGEGFLRPHLAAQIQKYDMGDHFCLEGMVPPSSVPSALASADLYILSSFTEAYGIGVEEAMASGLPVIATAVGGIPELVQDGKTGILTAPGDHDAMAEAICLLVDNPSIRLEMGLNGRRWLEQKHGLARAVELISAVYDTLIDTTASHWQCVEQLNR